MPLWQVLTLSALAAAVFVGLLAAVMSRRSCPRCGAALPKVRWPATVREALLGGGTCLQCGCKVDRRGKEGPASS